MKPFLHGKKSLGAAPLRAAVPAHIHRAEPTTGHVRPAASGPNVEVVKEGDRVTRLIVTCACGERIEVECLYPAGG